jgi:hypothetical protein
MKKPKLQKKKEKLIAKAEKLQKRKKELPTEFRKVDEKFSRDLEKMTVIYKVPKDEALILIDDPILYNGKKIRTFSSPVID